MYYFPVLDRVGGRFLYPKSSYFTTRLNEVVFLVPKMSESIPSTVILYVFDGINVEKVKVLVFASKATSSGETRSSLISTPSK